MDVVQFWNFFLLNTFVFLFWSIGGMFNNLLRTYNKIKSEKEVLNKINLATSNVIFVQKLLIFCTNYIPMFGRKKCISIKGFKILASKL